MTGDIINTVDLACKGRITAQRMPPTGTGGLLSTIAGIVERHGDEVWVVSEGGKGATFFFPVSPKDAE